MIDDIELRCPTETDAASLWRLIGDIDGIERNTLYAYLLLCTHFADGSLVAVHDGDIIGFVVGYRPPSRPDAMFVWQVGLHPGARGQGIATELLQQFTRLPAYRECTYLEATVGATNDASSALFRGFARRRGVPCEQGPGYPAELFAPHSHDDEILFRIGPLRS